MSCNIAYINKYVNNLFLSAPKPEEKEDRNQTDEEISPSLTSSNHDQNEELQSTACNEKNMLTTTAHVGSSKSLPSHKGSRVKDDGSRRGQLASEPQSLGQGVTISLPVTHQHDSHVVDTTKITFIEKYDMDDPDNLPRQMAKTATYGEDVRNQDVHMTEQEQGTTVEADRTLEAADVFVIKHDGNGEDVGASAGDDPAVTEMDMALEQETSGDTDNVQQNQFKVVEVSKDRFISADISSGGLPIDGPGDYSAVADEKLGNVVHQEASSATGTCNVDGTVVSVPTQVASHNTYLNFSNNVTDHCVVDISDKLADAVNIISTVSCIKAGDDLTRGKEESINNDDDNDRMDTEEHTPPTSGGNHVDMEQGGDTVLIIASEQVGSDSVNADSVSTQANMSSLQPPVDRSTTTICTKSSGCQETKTFEQRQR